MRVLIMPVIINDVPIHCIHHAAIQYRVPTLLLISVLKTEGGRVGMANKNVNGTYDYGPMQINSSWLPTLARYGYQQQDIQYNACKNIEVGAWILNQQLANNPKLWSGVGDYHSHTHNLNQHYAQAVYKRYERYEQLLQGVRT